MDIRTIMDKQNPALVDLLKTIRYALERCIELRDSKIVGIARYLELKSIKRGKQLYKIIGSAPHLFKKKGRTIELTELGRIYLSYIIQQPYPFEPLNIRYKRIESPTDIIYYLDGFFKEKGGKREPYTMVYKGKMIYLKNGKIVKTPKESNDVIAKIDHFNGSCRQTFNSDSPAKVEAYPPIAHLMWYTLENLEKIKETNLKTLIRNFPQKIFANIKKTNKTWKVKTPRKNIVLENTSFKLNN